MAISKKIEVSKDAYLLLTQQYCQLSKYRELEVRALGVRDFEGYEAAATSFQVQFQEMGEQLKILGLAMDKLGGPSVMFPKGPTVLPEQPLS